MGNLLSNGLFSLSARFTLKIKLKWGMGVSFHCMDPGELWGEIEIELKRK